MDMLDKRLNDKGKNWRHVLKSLKVLDYCLHEGSELVVTWARKNIYIIKTLREFMYTDEDGKDVGQNGKFAFFAEPSFWLTDYSSHICEGIDIAHP
jgi:epsin